MHVAHGEGLSAPAVIASIQQPADHGVAEVAAGSTARRPVLGKWRIQSPSCG